MKTILYILALFLQTSNLFAQYPFEKFVSINYEKYKIKTIAFDGKEIDFKNLSETDFYQIKINNFFEDKDTINIKIKPDWSNDNWNNSRTVPFIKIYRNNKLIQKFDSIYNFGCFNTPKHINVADINGDGLKDIKIALLNTSGNGMAYTIRTKMFLFQNKNGTFTKISFEDRDPNETEARLERDFNNDNNFEIIVNKLNNYNEHNY